MAKLNLSGIEVKAARVLVGMRGHRPSNFNRCVAEKLKGKEYAKPPKGQGGRNNPEVRRAFIQAVETCKGTTTSFRSSRHPIWEGKVG